MRKRTDYRAGVLYLKRLKPEGVSLKEFMKSKAKDGDNIAIIWLEGKGLTI